MCCFLPSRPIQHLHPNPLTSPPRPLLQQVQPPQQWQPQRLWPHAVPADVAATAAATAADCRACSRRRRSGGSSITTSNQQHRSAARRSAAAATELQAGAAALVAAAASIRGTTAIATNGATAAAAIAATNHVEAPTGAAQPPAATSIGAASAGMFSGYPPAHSRFACRTRGFWGFSPLLSLQVCHDEHLADCGPRCMSFHNISIHWRCTPVISFPHECSQVEQPTLGLHLLKDIAIILGQCCDCLHLSGL